MVFKSGFYLGGEAIPRDSSVREKVLSELPTPSKRASPLWEKEQLRVCLAFILVDWDHFSLKEPMLLLISNLVNSTAKLKYPTT